MVAIMRNETEMLQTTVIGACSSHSLLLLGLCFATGARNDDQADLPIALVRSNAKLLLMVLVGLVVPVTFAAWSPCQCYPESLFHVTAACTDY